MSSVPKWAVSCDLTLLQLFVDFVFLQSKPKTTAAQENHVYSKNGDEMRAEWVFQGLCAVLKVVCSSVIQWAEKGNEEASQWNQRHEHLREWIIQNHLRPHSKVLDNNSQT